MIGIEFFFGGSIGITLLLSDVVWFLKIWWKIKRKKVGL